MKKIMNPVYGVILFVIGLILISCLPPVYSKLDVTPLHWVSIYFIVIGVVYLIVSLVINWGKPLR